MTKVMLYVTKIYEITMNDTNNSDALEKANIVTKRRFANIKKVEGEIDFKELKGLEHWSWKIFNSTEDRENR